MATKTFSGRGDVGKLAYADALALREYGMSYGQYCGSILLDYVHAEHALPAVSTANEIREQRAAALARMREMSERLRGSKLAQMSDEDMKRLIAGRYE